MHVELSSRYGTPPMSSLALSFMSSTISWLPAVTISRVGIDELGLS